LLLRNKSLAIISLTRQAEIVLETDIVVASKYSGALHLCLDFIILCYKYFGALHLQGISFPLV
jgi:hypothetical protein